MNRFLKRDSQHRGINIEVDDEEQLYERQALIDDPELCDDEIDLLSANSIGVRQRQAANKKRTISNNNSFNGFENQAHELRNINRPKDYISEPVVEYTYYDIQPSDSLQSICLRKIKLPLGKFALLEDVIKSQQQDTNGRQNNQCTGISRSSMGINCPGSALSVSTRRLPQFKPLLSPGFSSDRINEMRQPSNEIENGSTSLVVNGNIRAQHNHSHSFSSLSQFVSEDSNIHAGPRQQLVDTKQLNQKNFIKSNLNRDEVTVDDLIMNETDTVGKVFEDLDYHVDQAKAAAQTYDQRAADLAGTINIDEPSDLNLLVRKNELFFCSENFGMNYKKLVIFIFVVCFVVPLVYIRQTTSVAT